MASPPFSKFPNCHFLHVYRKLLEPLVNQDLVKILLQIQLHMMYIRHIPFWCLSGSLDFFCTFFCFIKKNLTKEAHHNNREYDLDCNTVHLWLKLRIWRTGRNNGLHTGISVLRLQWSFCLTYIIHPLLFSPCYFHCQQWKHVSEKLKSM